MGRILVIEFDEHDSSPFNEIMRVLSKYSSHNQFHLQDESILSLPKLDIFLKQRKVYYGRIEIPLATKEFDVFCLPVANKGIVLTYGQMYDKLWKEDACGNVNNTVVCQVRSLRRKVNKAVPDPAFTIRCVRDVGYCLEVNKE